MTASNVTLTAAQRQNLHLYTVALSKFHKAIEATGVVDFDNDQATSVLAPFSGPVSRLLVSLGDHVKKGDPLAVVDSPDFAAAVSAYRKALATARTDRRLADLDKDLIQHQGVAQREADQAETDAVNAEADRDAALQALISLERSAADHQGHPGRPADSAPRGTDPLADRGNRGGKADHAGRAAAGRHHAVLYRCRSVARLGDGADLRFRSCVGQRRRFGRGGDRRRYEEPFRTVDNISALVDPDTRSVVVRVVVENPGNVLKKQMYVRVLIQARQESTGLLVPVSAILRDDENLPFVYVAQPDGSFARQHVTLGYRVGDQYEIDDGLKAGDQVVVEGGLFVQFMQNQ